MPTNILMPALSPTMTAGTLARWLKHEGDTIAAGDVLAEIETDKATMEVEAVDEGVLSRILVADGTENVAVNAPIAILTDPGEAQPDAPVDASSVPAPPAPAVQADAPAPIPPAANTRGNRIAASPLARRIAEQAGIPLTTLRGTGPNGRIVRADVDRALAAAPAPALAAPAAAPLAPIDAPHRLVPHTAIRKIVARRLTEAKQSIPHFYLSADIALDALLALRSELNALPQSNGTLSFKLSVNDLVIRAAALALRRVPEVNASFTEAATVLYTDVDIAVAVAIPDGLITPIIRRADTKTVAAISTEMRDLATRAKAGKLQPPEYQGGGFSISNLGMFGVDGFAAIINPPQAAILAVGAGAKRPIVRDDALAIATVMTCTLSVDHRVIDGAVGARFLAVLKNLIEAPLGLLL